jgi:predicted membrane protein DUF2142
LNFRNFNFFRAVGSWKDHWSIILLCGVAGLRVFLFSAAFPFFNNVDEQAHFDLVVKYSQGMIPTRLDFIAPEAARYMVLFGSPEYFRKPEQFPGGKIPTPFCNLPADQRQQRYEQQMDLWLKQINHEASSAPLYYLVAAGWLRLGRSLGLEDVHLLYWIRFLNVFVIAALLWLSSVAARMVFPGRPWLWLGVPLLLAFFPQDTFYSIQSDVLSPLCFGAAFICLLKWLPGTEAPNKRLSIITGLTLAATGLTKSSNLPLLVVALLFVLGKVWHLARAKRFRAAMPGLGLLAVCALLPIGAWLLWNRYVFGDVTGSEVKIQFLGWTHKAFADWWHHPIFTLRGAWTFASELMASFWRGEFVWSLGRLAWPMMDRFYLISSVLLIGLAIASLLRKSADKSSVRFQGLWLALASFIAMAGFLAFLSIAFDFGQCFYPSREQPYFTSGRLLCGALIPFLLLYVYGLDQALGRIKSKIAPLLVLSGVVLLIVISEIDISLPALHSEYNFFHL